MKKFITGLISLLLAGSMAFGLAACNNETDKNGNTPEGNTPEGNTPDGDDGDDGKLTEAEWKAAFSDLGALDNYTVTSTEIERQSLLLDGELLKKTDVLIADPDTSEPLLTGETLLEQMNMTENPKEETDVDLFKYDFANGKAQTGDEYCIADGVTVIQYNPNYDDITDPDDPEAEPEHVLSGYNKTVYTGYSSAEKAKSVLKKDKGNNDFAGQQFTGVGDNADKKGVLGELYEIFTYDKEENSYSADIYPLEMGEYIEEGLKFSIKFIFGDDEKIEKMVTVMKMEMDFSDMMGDSAEGMPEGLTMLTESIAESAFSDIGTTTVTLPGDIESKVKDSNERRVLSSETDWNSAWQDFNSSALAFDLPEVRGETVNDSENNKETTPVTKYNVTVSADRTKAFVKVYEYDEEVTNGDSQYKNESYKGYFYLIEEGALNVYEGESTDGNEYTWTKKESETQQGKTEVTEKLPELVRGYYGGYKALGETQTKTLDKMFGSFDYDGLSSYFIPLAEAQSFNRVSLDFYFDSEPDGKFTLNRLNFTGDEKMSVETIYAEFLEEIFTAE